MAKPKLPTPRLPRFLAHPSVRRAIGLWFVVQGLAGFLAPRQTIRMSAWVALHEVFENPRDLEPTDTAVALFRDASLATLVFGVLTLRRANQDRATANARSLLDESETEDDTGGEGGESEPDDEPDEE